MLREMRPGELGTWMALAHEWGEVRADLRAGIVASTMANIHRGRGTEAYSAQDFMPQYDKKEPQKDLAAKLKGFLMTRGRAPKKKG